MTLSERLEKTSGTIQCVRCHAPAATCEHSPARLPEWRRRALADQAKRGNVATKELVA
jgi:hypothetical protein